jgi:hypothetical protein
VTNVIAVVACCYLLLLMLLLLWCILIVHATTGRGGPRDGDCEKGATATISTRATPKYQVRPSTSLELCSLANTNYVLVNLFTKTIKSLQR